ncbi:MAG TPA: hypothetical protein ENH23_01700, partial [candidate division Zixibacteria bacterium]|nr:hypothetical protein [candidate division Zixibacteria bacterium]
MAKKKKNKVQKNYKVVGVLLFLAALVLLVALVTHRAVDDIRISDDSSQLSPFDQTMYKNQGGMLGAYLSFFTLTFMGWLSYFLPLGLLLLSFRLFKSELSETLRLNSSILFVVSLLSSMI